MKRLKKRDARCLEKHGCMYWQLKDLRAFCREMADEGVHRERQPIGAFCRQRQNAKNRGIKWDLKLWDWWMIWDASGKWEQRGRGAGYVMSRYGDEGPYQKDNVYICLARENNSQRKEKQSGLPMGVDKYQYGEGFQARAMKGGKMHFLGVYPTPDVAELAYLIFIHGEP
jgi:hypothetical protein